MTGGRGVLTLAMVLVSAGAAHADTMPQLDFHNPLLASQIVWGAAIFVVFYLLVSRWGLPKVDAVLEQRAAMIEATDTAAAVVARLTDGHADATRVGQAVGSILAERGLAA